MPDQDHIATTAFGLESVVVRELQDLQIAAKPVSTGRVLFRGDARTIARANLWLRAADRVLLRAAEFECRDFDTLFERVKTIPWERWVGPQMAFIVNGRSVKSQLSSVPALQRTVKKAMVERLMAAHGVGELPETGPRCVVEIALLADEATLTLDTSGEGLHKRGYRDLVGEAQLKETLAAGLVLLSVWRRERPLIDPFCGTGTIPIEAAMIGRNMAPGLVRSFDAERWHDADGGLWQEEREAARAAASTELTHPIHGFDIDPNQISMARHHAKRAGVADVCQFQVRDFRELASKLEYGVTIMNPPYGDRSGIGREIEELYRAFPDVLRRLPTWSHNILTSWDDFERLLGQPATRRRKLYNAQIECTYFQYLGPRPPKTLDGEPRASASGSLPETGGDHVASEITANEETHSLTLGAPGSSFGGLRPRDVKEADEFAACLSNNVRHLRKYPARGITCYRLYERDCPDVPLIVDRFEDCLHIQEYEREHSRTAAQHADWLDAMAARAAEICEVPRRKVYLKRKERQRGLTQHERHGDAAEVYTVREGGLSFEVNLSDYTDTGLFLDHRLTRDMVRQEAAGKRFLNLFCYTGSFTVYAAAGGASETTSVDLSNTYLDWAARNMRLNGFEGRQHSLVRADVMAWLVEQKPGPRYDLAVVDPPTFSNSKSTDDIFDVQRDHARLLNMTALLMPPGGVIYFSTNFRQFKFEEEELVNLSAREITRRTIPPEYRNTRIHRCWKLRVEPPAP